MHQLVRFHAAKPAYILMDYLLQKRIECIVTQDLESGTYWVEIKFDYDLKNAQAIVDEFIAHPSHPKYQAASWTSTQPVTKSIDCSAKSRSSVTEHPFFKSNIAREARANWVTSSILVFNALIFALYSVFPPINLWVGSYFFIVPLNELQATHEWWRILTPVFLHFSGMHIVFNLLWWWILGSMLEKSLGKIVLLLIFITTAASSNITQLLATGPNFGGMSGVVYGLLGFVWIIGYLRPSWGISLQPAMIGFMLIWLIIGFADVLFVSMANEAHLSGLIIGCLVALLMHQIAAKSSTSY